MASETYTKSGAKSTTPAKFDKDVFGQKQINHQLLKDAYLSYLANGRSNLAKAKKRGEVRGGGQKPWRQKGTGRARFGSSRNPIWTGGGAAFGPTGNENYGRTLNAKTKRQALRHSLSIAANENRIKIIEDLNFSDGKVKNALSLLNKIKAEGRVLLVVEQKNDQYLRSTRNVQRINLKSARYLSTFDIMNADTIVITRKALDSIHEHLGGKNA